MLMTQKDALLKRLSGAQFAAWELHMYLDTHPYDCEAEKMFKRYNGLASQLRDEYVNLYGPLSPKDDSGENWIRDPWPWDLTKEEY